MPPDHAQPVTRVRGRTTGSMPIPIGYPSALSRGVQPANGGTAVGSDREMSSHLRRRTPRCAEEPEIGQSPLKRADSPDLHGLSLDRQQAHSRADRRLRARLVALHQLRSAITSRPTNLGVDSCSVHWASAQANQPPASRTSRRAFAPDSLARVQEPGRPAVTTAAIQPPPAGTGSRPEGWTVRDWNCRGLPAARPGGVRRSVRASPGCL